MLTRVEYSRDAGALFAHVEACWNDARGARAMPRRIDINPSKLSRALPYVALIDVLAETPMDFRYRLMGQHLVTNAGQTLVGMRALALPPGTPTGRPLYDVYLRCVQTASPLRIDIDIANMNGTKRNVQCMIFPLGEDGKAPDALLSAGLFAD